MKGDEYVVNFEDGELVKGAYVVIDGKEYEVHMPKYKGKTPLSSENLNKMQMEIMKLMIPVGWYYLTQTDINPSQILGFGTWVRSKGRVIVGLDEDDEDFNEINKTGGEKTHTLTIAESASHTHEINVSGTKIAKANSNMSAGSTAFWNMSVGKEGEYDLSLDSVGGSQPHNNMQPYEVPGYLWQRRA